MIPVNKNVLIQPVVEKSAFQRSDTVYAEQGTVLAMADDVTDAPFSVGDTVHFDGHTASFRKDEQGNDVCFITVDRIRGKN